MIPASPLGGPPRSRRVPEPAVAPPELALVGAALVLLTSLARPGSSAA